MAQLTVTSKFIYLLCMYNSVGDLICWLNNININLHDKFSTVYPYPYSVGKYGVFTAG